MGNFQLFVQKHKQSAYILAAAFIAFINCCGFPFFNLNKEWPLMITALKIWAVVGGSWVSGILLAKLFREKKFPFIAFVVVCASIIGLICRYFLEFGEASNTYNFTIPNVLFHLAGMVAITFWGWLNATSQSEKVSWASIGKRKIVALILVLCFMCPCHDLRVYPDNGVTIECLIANAYPNCEEALEQWVLFEASKGQRDHSGAFLTVYNKTVDFHVPKSLD